MSEKITFIIPSLNRPTLQRSVDSLLNQTNPNWECIVVYDGVNGIKFKDTRIKIIESPKLGLIGPNNGQSGLVRNLGLKQCKTSWIGFLDDDDSLDYNYVETLLNKYSNYDFVVWRMVYQNGLILPSLQLNKLVFSNVGISFCFKNKFKDLFFEKNRDGEDFDFLMKLQSITTNFIITPEIFYKVRH